MKKIWAFPLALAIFACTNGEKNQKMEVKHYPKTAKVDTVDTYFGTDVPDPYHWLEDDRSEQTADWVKAQNEVTFGYLEEIPFRDKIEARLTKLWNYSKEGSPQKHGEYYYTYKNDGLQNQYIVYRKKGM